MGTRSPAVRGDLVLSTEARHLTRPQAHSYLPVWSFKLPSLSPGTTCGPSRPEDAGNSG